jgi:L-ascorbate metabolism protein UlaG (beta-lactamase superfamily)
MEITYLGHSSFKLKGKKATLVTDPYDPKAVGLKFPKVEADILTISHQHEDHNAKHNIAGTPFVIEGPGEYEVKGISVIGVSSFHDNEKGQQRGNNTMYSIEIDGIHLVHLGDLGHKLTEKDIEALGVVDILMVPVGGMYTITAKQAAELIPDIDPSVVIPMHYGRPELDQKIYGELTDLQTFLKAVGAEAVTPQSKLSITKDKLPETLQIIVLE